MKKFGLIGTGIAHSKSPALFNAAYGGRYGYDLLDGTDFKELADKFIKEYTAVNVTAPFKEDAFRLADERSEAAELCGVANMLIKGPGGRILADNSDFEGVTLSIMSAYAVAGIDVDDEDSFSEFLAGKTALVVGCGGAGRAAAAALVTLGAGQTVLWNRTEAKAAALKRRLEKYYDDLRDDEIRIASQDALAAEFKKADIVVYTLPAAPEQPLITNPAEGGSQGKIVLEANYNTPCLERPDGGYTYISGLNWLYNQAVISFEAFTGAEPDEEAMKKTL